MNELGSEDLLEKVDKLLGHYVDAVQETFGIYKMLNKNDIVLYVGKAKNLKKRLRSYKNYSDLSPRIRHMLTQVASISFIYTDKEADAFLLEARLIKQLRPRYNLIMKDDKSMSYVGLTQGLFPPSLVGGNAKRSISGESYGPFLSVKAAQRTIDALAQTFRLRTCPDSFYKNRTEPCLQYSLKRCSAPCVNKITFEAYMQDVQSARNFLKGDWDQVLNHLDEIKKKAAEEENYALAEHCQSRIEDLKAKSSSQVDLGVKDESVAIIAHAIQDDYINFFVRIINSKWDYGEGDYFSTNVRDMSEEDAIASFIMQFYSNRDVPNVIVVSVLPSNLPLVESALAQAKGSDSIALKLPETSELKSIMNAMQNSARGSMRERVKMRVEMEEILNKLQNHFKIQTPVRRVEIYDNSHLQMTNAFGAMVVFSPNGFFKNGYRKFAFKNPLAYRQDDATMMAEVVRRRLAMDDVDLPDLMILDGGRHQLAKVRAVLKDHNLNINVIAMAKRPDNGPEKFYLQENGDAICVEEESLLLFLRRVRDEVHRYVLTCHRMRRNRSMLKNSEDSVIIPGVGGVRWARLKEHFGSLERVYSATVEELMAVQGFNQKIAESIVFYTSKNKDNIKND